LHRALRRLTLFVALLAAGSAVACGSRPQGPPSILLLVVDALRADHVGSYGYGRDTTPTLDKLARDSVQFLRAYSPGNNTRTSVPAILTGLYPTATGVQRHVDVLHPAVPTLTEELSRAGYATGAFVANPSLRPEVDLNRGFDVYDYDPHLNESGLPYERYETAVKLQTRALEFLRTVKRNPYFVYIHYRDAHGPYVPPPPYDRRYWDPAAPVTSQRFLTPREFSRIGKYTRLPPPQTLEHYISQYDGEVRYTDDRIGEFLAQLRRLGLLDNTVVIVTADHGEAFIEHGEFDHGNELYDEELHVPLLLHLPGGHGAGSKVDVPVSGVDLLPTLAALTEVEAPTETQGRNLLPIIDAGHGRERPLFAAAESRRRAVRYENWKLVQLKGGKRRRLFDLSTDPHEQHDLSAARPDKLRELLELLREHERQSAQILAKRPSHRERMNKETKAGLKALGYL